MKGYTNHSSMAGQICYYCRNEGFEVDHFPPRSWVRHGYVGKKQPLLLVRCCTICNKTLSNSNQKGLMAPYAVVDVLHNQ